MGRTTDDALESIIVRKHDTTQARTPNLVTPLSGNNPAHAVRPKVHGEAPSVWSRPIDGRLGRWRLDRSQTPLNPASVFALVRHLHVRTTAPLKAFGIHRVHAPGQSDTSASLARAMKAIVIHNLLALDEKIAAVVRRGAESVSATKLDVHLADVAPHEVVVGGAWNSAREGMVVVLTDVLHACASDSLQPGNRRDSRH